jgi:hypothetical protein
VVVDDRTGFDSCGAVTKYFRQRQAASGEQTSLKKTSARDTVTKRSRFSFDRQHVISFESSVRALMPPVYDNRDCQSNSYRPRESPCRLSPIAEHRSEKLERGKWIGRCHRPFVALNIRNAEHELLG